MAEIHLHYLNHGDVQALAMTDGEILAAVEEALRAQGLGQVAIEARVHLVPEKDVTTLFWHRGLSLSDIALGAAMLEKAKRMGIGQRLRFR